LARSALGWEPTTGLREGLARTAAFLAEDAGVAATVPIVADGARKGDNG
jgi:hypothetical protein